MEKYIPKSDVIAEIERLKSIYNNEWDDKYVAKYTVLDLLKSNLDTIGVKEVNLDFEQELYKAFGQVKDFTLGMRIARHFFELGMAVSNEVQKGEKV